MVLFGVVLKLGVLVYTLMVTHGPLSSSFLGSPSRILNINHKKELLRDPKPWTLNPKPYRPYKPYRP